MDPSPLAGATLVLGVTGGIAAYKAVELLRLLTQVGANVEVVLTPEATRFVAPLTFQALSGRPVKVELWDTDDPIPHTRLGRSADLIVVAPATAHLIGRLACGLADDLLTNTLLASRAPVVVAPAMHTEMWDHAAVRRNVARLRADGITCVDPQVGPLAGGDVGAGRMAEPHDILSVCEDVMSRARPRDMAGLRIVVTAGGTREAIDPVRYLGNRSSGKMGHALADEAARRGASVVLVTTSALPCDASVKAEHAETAAEMHEVVLAHAEQADAVVMAAAVADFRPRAAATEKLKKAAGPPGIELEATPDILAELGERKQPGQFLVGFAAETQDVATAGVAKAQEKNLDLVVANLVGVEDSGFGSDTDRAYLCGTDSLVEDLGTLPKSELAALICDRVVAGLRQRRGEP